MSFRATGGRCQGVVCKYSGSAYRLLAMEDGWLHPPGRALVPLREETDRRYHGPVGSMDAFFKDSISSDVITGVKTTMALWKQVMVFPERCTKSCPLPQGRVVSITVVGYKWCVLFVPVAVAVVLICQRNKDHTSTALSV